MYENMYLMNNHTYVIEQQQPQEQQKKPWLIMAASVPAQEACVTNMSEVTIMMLCASAEQLTEYSLNAIAEMNGGLMKGI